MNRSKMVSRALLDIGAVGFAIDNPIRFKSGVLSPVYVDNRKFPFFPSQWKKVIRAMSVLVKEENLDFDVVAGIETAGIPHSAVLGYVLNKPSVFIRKEVKDHGTKKMIEGGSVKGQRVLLIEDHISTGGSSLHGVKVLRDEGAGVTACLAITSYGWAEATSNFSHHHTPLYTLTTFAEILAEAKKRGLVKNRGIETIMSWLINPKAWEENHEHN